MNFTKENRLRCTTSGKGITQTFKYEAQSVLFKDPVRTAL